MRVLWVRMVLKVSVGMKTGEEEAIDERKFKVFSESLRFFLRVQGFFVFF